MSNVSGAVKSIQDIMRKDVGVDGDAQRISQMVWMIFLKIYDDREEELELTEDDFTSPIPERFRWRNWAKVSSSQAVASSLVSKVRGAWWPRKVACHRPEGSCRMAPLPRARLLAISLCRPLVAWSCN